MLTLIEGPAGGGKSAVAAAMLEAGEIDILSDVTQIWVALSGVARGPDGRYPERLDDDEALQIALYLQATAVRHGLSGGLDVGVSSSRPDQVERWQTVASDTGAAFAVRTIDPGELIVRARLADAVTGALSPACERAISRWYG